MVLIAILLASRCFMPTGGGPSRVDSVKSLLRSFGVPGPYRLQALRLSEGSDRFGGMVELSDRSGERYTANFKPDSEQVTSLIRGSQDRAMPGFRRAPLVDRKLIRQAESWARVILPKEQFRLEAVTVDENNSGHADFSILRHGLPFISATQRYGCQFAFTVPEGKFLSLTTLSDPPPVDPRPARVTEAEALKAFSQIFAEEIAAPMLREHHWEMSYTLMKGRILGYYLPEREHVARLAWIIPFMQIRDVGYAKQGGSTSMLIDAISGRRIPTQLPVSPGRPRVR